MFLRARVLIALCAALQFTSTAGINAAATQRPNVVLILADDLGWKDLSCYGSDLYETPNIDKLAADGVKFTNAYSACTVCSPSRAALLTGKYPARLHLTDWIPGQMPDNPKLLVPDWTKYLSLQEKTIADMLKPAGYATASIGKWHLGGPEYYPEKHGFDINIAGTDKAETHSYFVPYQNPKLPDGPPGEYVTDRLTSEALKFMAQSKDKPFFLYLPHFAVHLPTQAKQEKIEKYRAKLKPGMKQTNPTYAAMLESLDESVGHVRAKLEELKLADNTIVVFASDNGARIPTSNSDPLRAGKGSCYEGGTRVPFIVYWPGVTKSGTVCETPVISMDIFPTLLEVAGIDDAAAKTADSKSLVPLLKGAGSVDHDALYWHYPHYQHYQLGGATPYSAIRAGDYKLIEFLDDMRVELYNLKNDICEKNNLASQQPQKVDELRNKLHAWRNEVGAQMPTRNPNYDPSRPEHTPRPKQNKELISLVPEKVPPVVADKQDFITPDRVRLTGWAGTRIDANEANRLAKLDTDRLLEGYRNRPGKQTWDGEHVGKWLHAATLAWANTGDDALRLRLDYTVQELMKCQQPDGYLGTYLEKDRWTEWDVWAHKYNLIGLITYMRYTGNMAPMETCKRMADLLCKTFGDEPGKRDIILAGNHMGMAPTSVLEPMVLLYRLTGEQRYLDFCKYILRAWEHPNGPKIISTLLTQKRVDKVGNGKAYEMLSCLNGALEYHRTVNDPQILEACLDAWQDIVAHRLYITGAASYREFFHGDFDLPNVSNVGETCVTVTWLQFNAQLLRLRGEARFAEQLERVVLNQLFGAQCPDGTAWGYYVQMEGRKPYSSNLYGHCCLSSGPRGVALVPTFALSTDADGIVVNLYDAGGARLNLRDGTSVTVTEESLYPSAGDVRLTLLGFGKHEFSLKLRKPEWCKQFKVLVNGQETEGTAGADGYVAIRRTWAKNDVITVTMGLEPHLLIGDHRNKNKVAFMYGPLVLAADQALLGEQGLSLSNIAVSTPTLEQAHVTSETANGDYRTWPGAHMFKVNAVVRETTGSHAAGTSVTLPLVPFADAGATSGTYRVWQPYGPAPVNDNLLYNGIESRSRKPGIGSVNDNDIQTIAATKGGKPTDLDWFAVELTEAAAVQRIVFYHGRNFPDGGWFDTTATKPRIEVKTAPDAKWQQVGTLDDYPATTAESPGELKDRQQFALALKEPINVIAVRVVGKPSGTGKTAFATCAELQAFGPAQQGESGH